MRAWMFVVVFAFALGAGCGGGGSDGNSTTPAAPLRFLYVSAYANAKTLTSTIPAAIYGYAVYPSGALSPVPGSPFAATDNFGRGGPIAITHDSKILYTLNGGLLAFQINADGSLTNAPVPSYSGPGQMEYLVAHPTADVLYVLGGEILTVFAIDSATGALTPTSSVSAAANSPGYYYSYDASSPAVLTLNGRYLYEDEIGAQPGQPETLRLEGFSTDATTGALSPVPGSPLTPTAHNPYADLVSYGLMAIDPTGKFLYVLYEYASFAHGNGGGVDAYSIDAASGALTAVPGSPFDVGGYPGSFAIDASGRFLIVCVGLQNGEPSTQRWPDALAVLSIDPGSGALSPVPGSPFAPQDFCSSVAADPSAPYVYVGSSGFKSTIPATVFVHSIDQATGALNPIGEATIPDKDVVAYIALTH